MTNLIRRFQQPLMITITILVIVAFTLLYNNTKSLDAVGSDRVATIYGENVSQGQYLRTARKYELCRFSTLIDLLRSLTSSAMSMDQAQQNFIFNSIIIDHEAAQLGITVTDAETIEEFKKLFSVNGQFDVTRYNQFVQNELTPRGFTRDQLEEIVRLDLTVQKLKNLLGCTAAPSPGEVRTAYEQDHQKYETSVIRLKLADFLKAAQVSDEDVKKAFEERKAQLMAGEKRKVKFVSFTLENVEKPLEGKDRVEALKKLMAQAEAFTQSMLDKGANFDELAAKNGGKVAESPEFEQDEPPAELGESEAAAQAAFKLTQQEPNSDVIGTDKGYYVLQLVSVAPARPLTFDEAKEKLTDTLKRERALEAMNLKGADLRAKLEPELKAGKSFADAATALGVTAEVIPAFSRAEWRQLKDPDAQTIISTAFDLSAGQIGMFAAGADGGVLVFLGKIQPIDEAKFEQDKVATTDALARYRREGIFREWLKARRKDATITTSLGVNS